MIDQEADRILKGVREIGQRPDGVWLRPGLFSRTLMWLDHEVVTVDLMATLDGPLRRPPTLTVDWNEVKARVLGNARDVEPEARHRYAVVVDSGLGSIGRPAADLTYQEALTWLQREAEGDPKRRTWALFSINQQGGWSLKCRWSAEKGQH